MKIVHVETIFSCGSFPSSREWKKIRADIHRAVKKCVWPPGAKKFTIHPQSGKKRGEGNGVKPIRENFIKELRKLEWTIEGSAKNQLGEALGDFDAAIESTEGPIVVEWETGNVSSTHRSMNKMAMLVSEGRIAAGCLIIPSRRLYPYLTDRIGNFDEIKPYLRFWKSTPCARGVLEIVVIEHDATSLRVRRIPKGTDGRARI